MIVRSAAKPGGRAGEHRHRGGSPGAPRHRSALHRRPHPARRRARRGRCDADEALPPFWAELAGLGWTGLHLPEAVGGEGYGFAELAVVVEELGRALAPGPFLPSVWASAAIARRPRVPKELLERLARGEAVGTVALGPAGRRRRRRRRRARPRAAPRRPVLGASLADLLLVPARDR